MVLQQFLACCRLLSDVGFFVHKRGEPGPLFRLQDGSPLHRAMFVQQVQAALSASGLVGSNFNRHIFRIGAATSTSTAGVPESTIKVLGRWQSVA